MKYPTKVIVNGKEYKINTDFRVAIECNELVQDKNISDYERALAIIYKLFGDAGLNDFENHVKLQEYAVKYLSCGKELTNDNTQPDMDYVQDEGYIRSSFQFDYKYDPYELEHCHWWKFFNDLCNLSNSELGNCCILNRVRNIRNLDLNKIKDAKEKEKMRKAKEQVALKKQETEIKLTEKQQKSVDEFYKALGY